jgi:hypothetical protein
VQMYHDLRDTVKDAEYSGKEGLLKWLTEQQKVDVSKFLSKWFPVISTSNGTDKVTEKDKRSLNQTVPVNEVVPKPSSKNKTEIKTKIDFKKHFIPGLTTSSDMKIFLTKAERKVIKKSGPWLSALTGSVGTVRELNKAGVLSPPINDDHAKAAFISMLKKIAAEPTVGFNMSDLTHALYAEPSVVLAPTKHIGLINTTASAKPLAARQESGTALEAEIAEFVDFVDAFVGSLGLAKE